MGSAVQALIVVIGVEQSIRSSRWEFFRSALVYSPLILGVWCIHQASVFIVSGYSFVEEVFGIALEVAALFFLVVLYLQLMPKGFKLEIIFDALLSRKKQTK
jgi:hypothetical protein